MNPLTEKCTNMFSERSEELGWGRERKNDPADMWHMLKICKRRYLLLYIDIIMYECIVILPPEWSKCKNFDFFWNLREILG